MEKKNVELHLFREQLFILCNKQLDVFEYMEKWIAQLLQYPAEKTTCPVFVFQEGCYVKKISWNDEIFRGDRYEKSCWNF